MNATSVQAFVSIDLSNDFDKHPVPFSVLVPYFDLKIKKGLQRELQAFDIQQILVGSASFELATPAV
jgi:hypothetical protein